MRHATRRQETRRAPTGRRGWRGGAMLLASALLLAPGPDAALGQETEPEPLSKSQLIRQLATTPDRQDRIVERVEESCLSFDPTEQDLEDLQAVGANPDVIEAVRTCTAESDEEPLTADLRRGSSTGAGDTATVVVQLQGEGRTAAGVALQVRSPGNGSGRRLPVRAADTTDFTGRASLRVAPEGTSAADSLLLSSPEVALRGDTLLVLRPRAGEPAAQQRGVSGEQEGSPSPSGSGGDAEASSPAAADRGASLLRSGRPFAAMESYRRAVEEDAADAASWAGLGRAWLSAGYPDRARHAVHRAVELAPEDEETRRSLERLRASHPRYRLTLGGGQTVAWGPGGDDAAPVTVGRIAARPAPALHLWAGYDDAVGRHLPALVRGGEIQPETVYGGVGYDWGADQRLTTRLEAGRRRRSSQLVQAIYRAEQTVRLSWGERPLDITVGGLLGRWYDRDDWLVYGEFTVPVSSRVRLRPRLSSGTTVGTAFPDTLRRAARDTRVGLAVDVRPAPRLTIVTSATYGKVDYRARARGYEGWVEVGRSDTTAAPGSSPASTDPAANSATLFGLDVRVSGRIVGSQRLFVDVGHQHPPAGGSFTSLAAGVTLGVP